LIEILKVNNGVAYMKSVLEDMTRCVGCTACSVGCPFGCISMTEDKEGFLISQIDQKKCTDCGTCLRVCPILNNCRQPFQAHAYAAWSTDEALRMNSSSGGLFSVIAGKVLEMGGYVFGAAFNEDFSVSHRWCRNIEDLDLLRRSKYVQSNMGQAYKEAEAALKAGAHVLFTGTPCQIAGLKTYLRKEYDNLLTMDIACHGVPSPKVWEMYLKFMQSKYNSAVRSISFRDKKYGWTNASISIDFESGEHYSEGLLNDPYYNGFGKSLFNRRSCFDCRFRHKQTAADITLADFWGIEKFGENDEPLSKAISDNKGISLVLINTEKGGKMLESISDRINLRKMDYEKSVSGNPRLITSAGMPKARDSFFRDLEKGDTFEKLAGRYMNAKGMKQKIKMLLKSILSPKMVERLNKLRMK
jgi:coenzyme F420-reducing hydrogenase beta subunit